MRAVVQRVERASVWVVAAGDNPPEVVGSIGTGLCVLVGVTHTDTPAQAERLADKLWHLRVFEDERGVMNRSVADLDAAAVTSGSPRPGILVVSQFTLYGDTTKGRRPSWVAAAPPHEAEPLVDRVVAALGSLGAQVATGRFRAEMRVDLLNDGPVTLIVDV